MNSGGNAGDPARERGPRDGEGFDLSNPARSFVSTVRKVFFEPTRFFRRLPTRGRDRNPVAFAIVCALLSFPLTLLVTPFDPLVEDAPSLLDPLAGLVSEPGEAVAAVVVLVLTILVLVPLLVLLVLYISAAIYHILVRIFVRPEDTDFQTTLRVVVYTSAVELLLTWIPVVGLLASLYGLYLTFVGIRVHETTTARALAVMLLPVVLTLLLTLPGLLSIIRG